MKAYGIWIKMLVGVAIAVLTYQQASAFPNEPVVMILQPKGMVHYCSSSGKAWELVYRNKFLFTGNRVRTGDDGSCILMNQSNKMTWILEKNSEVEINSEKIYLISGSLTEGEPATDLLGNLKRKFASVQKYTVVLRSPKKEQPITLQTVNPIVLCEEYPDLVWENVSGQYSYRLVVGDQIFEIPKTTGEIVRFTLPPMTPGQYPYYIQVVSDGNIIYEPKEKNILRWLPASERQTLKNGELSIEKFDSNNEFLIGNYLDEQGIKVAAMDKYESFFKNNPDAQELKPFLIKIYDELKLNKLKEKEKLQFNAR